MTTKARISLHLFICALVLCAMALTAGRAYWYGAAATVLFIVAVGLLVSHIFVKGKPDG